ncbi:MAG: hypothetical protein JKX94_04560 [Sneathiella sp.]|nr:hypothetical protein [Sneathiella sp.]
MQSFSVETAGFVALTITELLLQECVRKGVITEQEVKHLLRSAARRHDDAAEGDQEKIDLNMEAAHMIRTLLQGLAPMFKEETDETAEQKIKNSIEPKTKINTVAEEISAAIEGEV